MNANEEYKRMLVSAAAVGFPLIGRWTAAKILFVVYKYGGAREEFTFNPKFLDEMRYIQQMYGVDGGEVPDEEVAAYIQLLEEENTEEIPQWANDLCKERYGFSLTNVQSNEINKTDTKRN